MLDALVDELNGTIALQQKFAKAGDFEKFMAADNDFHAQLYAATGNRALWDLVRSRSGQRPACAGCICPRRARRKTSCAITNSS